MQSWGQVHNMAIGFLAASLKNEIWRFQIFVGDVLAIPSGFGTVEVGIAEIEKSWKIQKF